MFQTVSGPGERLVQEPGIAALHRNYPYLRLFFGRFLADVAVRTEAGRTVVEWLIPDGQGSPPGEERIRQELEAFYHVLARAHREVRGNLPPGPPQRERGAVQKTLAALVLGKFRVPVSAEDVVFTTTGDMVVVNWCVDRPGAGATDRRLAQIQDPKEVIQKLAKALGVTEPPLLQPLPAPSRLRQPVPGTDPTRSPGALRPRSPFAAEPTRGFPWYILLLACVVGLVAGCLIAVMAQRGQGQPGDRSGPANGTPSAPRSPDAASTIDLSNQVDLNVKNMRAWVWRDGDGKGKTTVTVWLPVSDEVKVTGVRLPAKPDTPQRRWLVYEAESQDKSGFGSVTFRTPEGTVDLETSQISRMKVW